MEVWNENYYFWFFKFFLLAGCTDAETEASIANEEFIQEQRDLRKSMDKTFDNLDFANNLEQEIEELQSAFSDAMLSGDDKKIDEISARLDELIEEAERRLNE